MEHLSTFKLTRDPFANEPQLTSYYESPCHADAERRLGRAAHQGKGLVVLTGQGGVGKTLLVRRLLEALPEEMFEACMLVPLPGITDGHWILDRFARQLGVEEPAADAQALIGQIYEQLAVVREDGRHTVLIFDEAQVLVEQGLLPELRGLLNLEYEERRMLTLLLVGLPSLASAIRREPALRDRVDLRIEMPALDATYAAQYLSHRILSVGGNPAILDPSAVDALVKAARGIPRHLNSMADGALFEAHLAGRVAVSAIDVERAARDLDLFDEDERSASDAGSIPEPTMAPPRAVQGLQAPKPPPTHAREKAAPGALGVDEVVAAETDPRLGLSEPVSADPADGLEAMEFGPGLPGSPAAEPGLPEILADGPTADGEIDDLFANLVDD